MSPFVRAVRRRCWPLAALYLLVGAVEAAADLRPLDRALLVEGIDAAHR